MRKKRSNGSSLNNNWSQEIINLLKNWKEQININENAHLFRATRYKYLNNFFIIFNFIGNTSVLITLLTAFSDRVLNYDPLIFVTVVSGLTMLSSSLSDYYDFSECSHKNFEDAKKYNDLGKFVTSTISLPSRERGDAKETVEYIRKKFMKISEESMDLPYNKKVHQLELQIFENPKDARGDGGSGSSNSDSAEEKNSNVILKESLEINKTENNSNSNNLNYIDYQWRRFELNE